MIWVKVHHYQLIADILFLIGTSGLVWIVVQEASHAILETFYHASCDAKNFKTFKDNMFNILS